MKPVVYYSTHFGDVAAPGFKQKADGKPQKASKMSFADIYTNVSAYAFAHAFSYAFALVTGFVFAGFISCLWPLIARREVSFGLLFPASSLVAFEVLVVVFATPLLLLQLAVGQLSKGRYRSLAWSALAGAVFAGFFQGVAVLSVMFQMG